MSYLFPWDPTDSGNGPRATTAARGSARGIGTLASRSGFLLLLQGGFNGAVWQSAERYTTLRNYELHRARRNEHITLHPLNNRQVSPHIELAHIEPKHFPRGVGEPLVVISHSAELDLRVRKPNPPLRTSSSLSFSFCMPSWCAGSHKRPETRIGLPLHNRQNSFS